MKDIFRQSNLHRFNTMGGNFNWQVPRINTHSSGSFYYDTFENWNRLPDAIKSITLKFVFKRSVQTKKLKISLVQTETHLLDHMDVKLNVFVLMFGVSIYASMFHLFQYF